MTDFYGNREPIFFAFESLLAQEVVKATYSHMPDSLVTGSTDTNTTQWKMRRRCSQWLNIPSDLYETDVRHARPAATY
jgi:hypothetical protein